MSKSYEIISLIGEGNFGKIWKAKSKIYGEVAIKIVDIEKSEKIFAGAIDNEVNILKKLANSGHHNNVLFYYDSYIDGNLLYIITEYIDGIMFKDYIKNSSNTNDEFWFLVKQLVEGLYFIHSNGVAHRDIKPHNIIINRNSLNIKYIDFGLACDISSCYGNPGTILFYPPEYFQTRMAIINNEPVPNLKLTREMVVERGQLHDIWSLGVTIHQLFYGLWNLPFKVLPRLSWSIDEDNDQFCPPCFNKDNFLTLDVRSLRTDLDTQYGYIYYLNYVGPPQTDRKINFLLEMMLTNSLESRADIYEVTDYLDSIFI